MIRFSFIFAIFSGVMSVAFGIFGMLDTLILKSTLIHELSSIWETAASFQLIHTVIIFLIARPTTNLNSIWQKHSLLFFILGICLFSGSLYSIVIFNSLSPMPIIPIGRVCFLIGWVCLIVGVLRRKVSGKP